MTIPVKVERTNGVYTASVFGQQQLCAIGGTHEEAIGALRDALVPQVASGELAFIDLENEGITALASGKYKDDPGWHAMWDDVAAEAYRYRDQLKAQEFPE